MKTSRACAILAAVMFWPMGGCENSLPGLRRKKRDESDARRLEVVGPAALTSTTNVSAPGRSCSLRPGTFLRARSAKQMGVFARIELSEKIKGCVLTVGYVPLNAVRVVSGEPLAGAQGSPAPTFTVSPPSGASPVKTANARKAFLDVIAHAEGTRGRGNDGYNVIYSYQFFSSYADHPRRLVCNNYCSDAAGRYQFLSTTWDGARRNMSLSDFGPSNQDKGGDYLVRNRGVKNHEQVLSREAFSNAILKLGKEWASLPGSPYGQPIKSMDELWRVYSGLVK